MPVSLTELAQTLIPIAALAVILVPPLWKLLRSTARLLDRVDEVKDRLTQQNGRIGRLEDKTHEHEIDVARVIAYLEGQGGKTLGELRKDTPS